MGKPYVFDPRELHECAKLGVSLHVDEACDVISRELHRRYPGLIDRSPRKWIFNNAGGAMGMLCLLYGSLSEYVILFGSPIGTEGHSGRYVSEVYDWVFSGEMWTYTEGQTERSVYGPGSEAYLGAGKTKGYRIPDHAFMLEYARGPIPAMLPFGLADSIFSTLDHRALGRTLWHYGRLVVRNLARGNI